MLKRMRRQTQPNIGFSESRGKACDAVCRGNTLIEQQRTRLLLSGWKQA